VGVTFSLSTSTPTFHLTFPPPPLRSRFGELKPLTKLPHLTNLALHGNPVAAKKHYRNYVLHLLPNLTKLDFSCITKQDRVHSQTWAMFFRKKLAKKGDDEE
jgi:hypothetical protein